MKAANRTTSKAWVEQVIGRSRWPRGFKSSWPHIVAVTDGKKKKGASAGGLRAEGSTATQQVQSGLRMVAC